ncbi:hypothetical protein L0664_07690 [Octadecabacter sp. G9-8]|uniref:Uncharacterized protein n=1 Tax=Octadecabacter dasysiphoniae TaxID=2909341 RepID=A0ABS9CUU9_9RHOB|nr:MATE family efflux transporter [Octadecabacter dasysiphoniae]MCF2870943.1 hypothetical protein [Octadecabacter dasysiphoniae]
MERKSTYGATGITLILRVFRTLVSRTISAFGSLLLTYVISASLGLSALGVFSSAAAVMLGVVILSNFGSSTLIIKTAGINLSQGDFGAARATYLNAAKLSLLGTLAAAILGVLYVAYFDGPIIVMWLLICAPGVALLLLNAAMFRANLDASIAPFCEFGFLSLAASAVLLGAQYLGTDVTLTRLGLILFVITYVVLGVSFVVLARRISGFWSQPISVAQAVLDHPRKTKNFFVMEFAQYFSQWGLILVIGLFVSSQEVGTFSAILKLAFLVNFILGVMSNTVSAQISSLYADNNFERVAKVRGQARLIMLGIALPVALILFVFNQPILAQFQITAANASLILTGLLVVQVLNVATGISPVVLKMVGHERYLRNVVMFTFALQLGLALLLTPMLGIAGAAIAFAAGLLTKNAMAIQFEMRHLSTTKRSNTDV